MREHADFGLKIKSIDETGRFTGIGAVYGNVDEGGDKILPGAFSRTLQATKGVVPLLWQHKSDSPIGSAKVSDSPQGLQVEGQLELDDPTGAKAYRFLKSGIIRGLSIGYQTIKSAFVDDVRELQELKLFEMSIVTFPMNPEALITSVKALSDADRSKHLKAIDVHRRAIDRHGRAMRESLKSLFGGYSDDEPIDSEDEPDDPALLEDDYGEMSALVSEFKKLTALARGDA